MLLYYYNGQKHIMVKNQSAYSQGEQFLLSQTIVDGIATLFLAQYETNIPDKNGSQLFGFLLDAHFMDWEQIGDLMKTLK